MTSKILKETSISEFTDILRLFIFQLFLLGGKDTFSWFATTFFTDMDEYAGLSLILISLAIQLICEFTVVETFM